MNLRRSFLALASVTLALAGGMAARADVLLNADRTGWVNALGLSSPLPISENYIAGRFALVEYRNFFVFDLTGVNSMITGATLNLYNPSNGYAGHSTETFQLTSTLAPPSFLSNNFGPVTGALAFTTLGTGTSFGTLVASAANNGQTMTLNFNAAGLAYLNANLGQQVAFGGRVTSLSGATNQHVFGYTDPTGTNPILPNTPPVTLNLQVTPEMPAGVQAVPVLLAVGGMVLYQRRKKKA